MRWIALTLRVFLYRPSESRNVERIELMLRHGGHAERRDRYSSPRVIPGVLLHVSKWQRLRQTAVRDGPAIAQIVRTGDFETNNDEKLMGMTK